MLPFNLTTPSIPVAIDEGENVCFAEANIMMNGYIFSGIVFLRDGPTISNSSPPLMELLVFLFHGSKIQSKSMENKQVAIQ